MSYKLKTNASLSKTEDERRHNNQTNGMKLANSSTIKGVGNAAVVLNYTKNVVPKQTTVSIGENSKNFSK